MKMQPKFVWLAGAAVVALPLGAHAQVADQPAAAPTASAAQEAPAEDIVVTAERRAESVQSLPIAISAYDSAQLLDRGVVNLNALSQLSPSVRVPANANGGMGVNIVVRGIGSFGGFEPAVAMVQDGVSYSSRSIGSFDFFDVQRVEVLRGPQGTLGGRNATAGGVYIVSAPPTEEVEGYVQATFGNYNRIGVEGAVSGPLAGDKLLARLSFQVDRANGWIDEVNTRTDFGGLDKRQARLYLLARPSDTLKLSLILQGRADRALPATVTFGRARPDRPSLQEVQGVRQFDPRTRTFSQDQTDIRNDRFFQGTFRADWDISDALRFSATTGYVKSNLLYNEDQDHSDAPAVIWKPIPRRQPFWQFSQEATLSGDVGDRFDFIVGGLFMKYHYKLSANLALPLQGLPIGALFSLDEQRLTSWAGFGQLRYGITDALRLTAGARYTHDSKSNFSLFDFGPGGALTGAGKLSSAAWTPKASLDWQPDQQTTVYISASRGFKSGGFDAFAFPARSYNPEYVWNYEAGVKLKSRDRRFGGSLTGFIMDYSNLQQSVFGLDPGQISFRTINAAQAKIRGVEGDLQLSPWEGFTLSGSAAYLSTKYVGLRTADPTYLERGVIDLTGNQLAGAPKWQFNVSADYNHKLGNEWTAAFNANYAWNGRVPLDIYNNPGFFQDSVGILNLSASISDPGERWKFTVFGTNVSDELYVSNALSADYGGGGLIRLTSFGDPRRYGVRVSRRF